MKMLLGNLLFGGILLSWYFYVGRDGDWFLSGMVLAFVSFLGGTCMGYILRGPGRSRRIVSQYAAHPLLADSPVDGAAAHQSAPPPPAALPVEEPSADDLDDLEVMPEAPSGTSELDVADQENPEEPIAETRAAAMPHATEKAGHHTEQDIDDHDIVATLE